MTHPKRNTMTQRPLLPPAPGAGGGLCAPSKHTRRHPDPPTDRGQISRDWDDKEYEWWQTTAWMSAPGPAASTTATTWMYRDHTTAAFQWQQAGNPAQGRLGDNAMSKEKGPATGRAASGQRPAAPLNFTVATMGEPVASIRVHQPGCQPPGTPCCQIFSPAGPGDHSCVKAIMPKPISC